MTSETVPETGFIDLGQGIDTALGGAFYLVNLMLHLDLPGCFEDDWRLATGLGPWGLLDLLCRALLEDAASPFVEDPLWAVLAALDGREPGTWPGASLQGSDEFHLPAHWPLAGAAALLWAVDGGRLWLWSEAGFVLADTALGAGPAESRAAGLAGGYGEAPPLRRASPAGIPLAAIQGPWSSGLAAAPRRWLERAMPYLRYRLRRGLDRAGNPPPLVEAVLFHPARVYVSAAHVDVVMSLDEVSLPLRAAGLDRDPGWLPEFGRVVLFHFE